MVRPKPDAAGVDVARFVEAEEGPEHILVAIGRDAGAIVIDGDFRPMCGPRMAWSRALVP